jgi:hypothetical protein
LLFQDLSFLCSYCPLRFESELSLTSHITNGHKLLASANGNNAANISNRGNIASVANCSNSGLVISPVSLSGAVTLARFGKWY